MFDASMTPVLVALLGTISVFLLAAGVISYVSGGRDVERLRERLESNEPMLPEAKEKKKGSPLKAVESIFTSLGEKLGPKESDELSASQMAMIQAGVRSPNAGVVFQGVKAFLTLSLAGAAIFARTMFFQDIALHWSIAMVTFGAGIGCFVPELWLSSKTTTRKTTISNELPDALDLLVVCVEAGMGLDQAIYRVSKELAGSAPLISAELKILTLQLRAGKPRQDALRELSRRVGLEDLNSLSTLLIQADVFGISVSQTLRVYSDALRTKRTQRAEEKAAKLPVKLLIPLIVFILPALFIAIMGPAGLRMMDMMGSMGN